ncbi:MarR family winged helix-turn-helix transcriptional regulator [Streptomyces sp. LN704]|uniref:MarR family winged helix-turn-helix transcriptional regulator n=1 Tax=unclassified Streptomyces TaxID=2593676 RepID=UPI00371A53F9
MAERAQYEELARQLTAIGAVKRELARILPHDCPAGSAAVLTLLGRHGDMRMSKLAELLAVDMSVTSRHVTHVADRGWIERLPDPADKRSRILRLTGAGLTRLDELSQRSSQLFADRLSDWSDQEVGLLSHLMGRLRESFGDCRATQRPPCPTEVQAVHATEPTTTRTPA